MKKTKTHRPVQRKKVLFLCTGNSARSIMAEAILTQFGKDRYIVYSAGSKPAKRANPYAIKVIEKNGLASSKLRPKSWEEFVGKEFDYIVTVCERAAKEYCPVFPFNFQKHHWNIKDPVRFEGTEEEKLEEFFKTFLLLKRRITTLFLS